MKKLLALSLCLILVLSSLCQIALATTDKEWSGNSVNYKVGDLVSYQNTQYMCLQDHISLSTWNPVDAVSLWKTNLKSKNTVISDELNQKILKLNSKYKNTKIDLRPQELTNKNTKTYNARSLNNTETVNNLLTDKEKNPMLEFKSVDELESFLDKLETINKTGVEEIKYINAPSRSMTRGSDLNGSYEFSWNDSSWWQYATLAWEIAINKNIKAEYTYKWVNNKVEFVSAKKASSWISGLTVARSWTQQGDATMNISSQNRNNDKLTVSVTGLYVIGATIKIDGVTIPAGISSTQTWTRSLIFI